jgi:hypothetical protein
MRHDNVPFAIRESQDRRINSVKRRIRPRRRDQQERWVITVANQSPFVVVRTLNLGSRSLGSSLGADRRNQYRHGLRKVNI